MKYTKVVLGSIILFSALLAGCSNNSKINKLSLDAQTLNDKVNQLSDDIQSLGTEVQIAKDEAVRANQRLDNQISKYKK